MLTFSPLERYNWGYWDGASARKRGIAFPEWYKPTASMRLDKMHFDKYYGAGFAEGWYGYPVEPVTVVAKKAKKAREI